jgi:hypothetical protein
MRKSIRAMGHGFYVETRAGALGFRPFPATISAWAN